MTKADKLKAGVRSRLGDHKPVSFMENVLEDKAPSKKAMRLTIDLIKKYELNPRIKRNEAYDEIKESIRNIGLELPLAVTKRPGEREYVLSKGGGTRLAILNELWTETKDLSFFEVDCIFEPYVDEATIHASHVVENDARGKPTFFERAKTHMDMKTLLEDKHGRELGMRESAELMAKRGMTADHAALGRYAYVLELYQYVPLALENAVLTKPMVETLRKHHKASKATWLKYSSDEEKFEELWGQSLQTFDSEKDFDVDAVQAYFETVAATELGSDTGLITSEVDMLLGSPATEKVAQAADDDHPFSGESTPAEVKQPAQRSKPKKRIKPVKRELSLVPSFIERPSKKGGFTKAKAKVEARLKLWETDFDSDPLFVATKRVVAWIDQIFTQLNVPCQSRDGDEGPVYVDIDRDRYMCFLRPLEHDITGELFVDHVWLRVAQSLYGPYLLDQNKASVGDLEQIIDSGVSMERILYMTSVSRLMFSDPDYTWVDECLCALERAIYEFHGIRRTQPDPEINPLGVLVQNQ